MTTPLPLLEVKDLQTFFFTEQGTAKAVDHVNFHIMPGQILGIVGESGCGKSVTAHSILRLIPSPPGKIVGGEILFQGNNLLTLSQEAMNAVRGNDISMIFQEPMTALNPVFPVQDQIMEAIQRHLKLSRQDARARTIELLRQVGIPSPEERMTHYPHQMSGGMRQRVMIAMALACDPKLLIADEPTTALDVTIQAQILDLLRKLRDTTGAAIMLITHDLGVMAEMAEEVLVMYTGRVVERAPVRELFNRPLHPYTRALMRSIPGRPANIGKKRLDAIPGVVPSLLNLPAGCKFNTRCPHAFDRCLVDPEPELRVPDGGHPVRCRLHESQEGK